MAQPADKPDLGGGPSTTWERQNRERRELERLDREKTEREAKAKLEKLSAVRTEEEEKRWALQMIFFVIACVVAGAVIFGVIGYYFLWTVK